MRFSRAQSARLGDDDTFDRPCFFAQIRRAFALLPIATAELARWLGGEKERI